MRVVRSRRLAWLLLIALLGTQWLALVHGALHGRYASALPAATVGVAQAAQAAVQEPETGAHAWLAGLFGDHKRPADCRLYDQAAGGDHAPALAKLALPQAGAADAPPRWVQRAWVAAVVPLFHARAPPALG